MSFLCSLRLELGTRTLCQDSIGKKTEPTPGFWGYLNSLLELWNIACDAQIMLPPARQVAPRA